jgi:hypothetical protein
MFVFLWTYITMNIFQIKVLGLNAIYIWYHVTVFWKMNSFEKTDREVRFQIHIEAGVIEQIRNTKFGPWISVYIPSVSNVIETLSVILLSFYAFWPPLWSSGQSSWLQIQRSRVRFPALPHFLRSRGSGTGSTQLREDNWGATWKDSSGSGLEDRN